MAPFDALRCWYCCECGDGPNNPNLTIRCVLCQHFRCSSCWGGPKREYSSFSGSLLSSNTESGSVVSAVNQPGTVERDTYRQNHELANPPVDLWNTNSRYTEQTDPAALNRLEWLIKALKRRRGSTNGQDSNSNQDLPDFYQEPDANGGYFEPTIHPEELFQTKLLELYENQERIKRIDPQWKTVSQTIINELSSVDPSSIVTYRENDLSWPNRLKNRIEEFSGEEWNWWPLSCPRRTITSKEALVEWKWDCGEIQSRKVPDYFAEVVEHHVREHARELVVYMARPTSSSGSSPQNQPQGSTSSRPPNVQRHRRSTKKRARSSNQAPANIQLQNLTTAAQTLQQENPQVLLVVNAGSYKLSKILVQGLGTEQFFQKLRTEYRSLRGMLRHHLSIWHYAHCEFYRFLKFDERQYEPKQKDEYPPEDDSNYKYDPRPMVRMPIGPYEFKQRFYPPSELFTHSYIVLCSKTCKCRKKANKSHNDDVIPLLPKRICVFDERSETREDFWGLYAKDEPQFWRAVVWIVVSVAPMVWFFFMWLFAWGHGGDMQNASVLLTLGLAGMSLLWCVFFACLRVEKHP